MRQLGRNYSAADNYRYGFNGKENDNEVKGVEGSQQDYGMRIYDPRLGRFLSVDPLARLFSGNSPYSYAEGDVLRSIDLDGLEKYIVTNIYDNQNRIVRKSIVSVVTKDDSKAIVDIDFKYANNGKDVTSNSVIVFDVRFDGTHTKNEFSELDKSDQAFYDSYKRNRHENSPGSSFEIGSGGIEMFELKRYKREEYSYTVAAANYIYPPPIVAVNAPAPTMSPLSPTLNFKPGEPDLATKADIDVVNSIATSAPNNVINGASRMNPNGSTSQTRTTNRSTISIDLTTDLGDHPTTRTLLENRYQVLRRTLVSQGVPPNRISRGTFSMGLPSSAVPATGNLTTFNIRTTTTQTTTTTTTVPRQIIPF